MGTSTNVFSDAGSHNRLRHFYDSHGNLDVLHEQYSGGSTDTHSFAYDDQNRLTDGFGSNTFAYDSSGRLEFFEDEDYTPLSNAFPVHAVKGSDYAYDANGNMTSRPNYTLSWDHENRLASVTGGGIYPSEDYLYDADGVRVKKTSDGVETYYPFPHYEVHDGTVVRYYFFGGMRIAQRRDGTLTYLHGNHLGSTVLETSTSGVEVNNERYFAYGEQRGLGQVNTENQYTDQKRDDTGLYYYGARYYDPALGTFVSPDTIVPNASHVFGYNRFMYVYGNPLNYVDPTGQCRKAADDSLDFAIDCNLQNFTDLDWDLRLQWMQQFANTFTNGQYFNNILGIIEYFQGDAIFSTSAWASVSDAGVLLAIQDGQRQVLGDAAIGNYGDFLKSGGEGNPADAWEAFFKTVTPNGAELALWGDAEQLGVDYGTFLAEPLALNAELAEQIQIGTFVTFGNLYRGVVSTGIVNNMEPIQADCYLYIGCAYSGSPLTPMLHPTHSQSFVRGFSRYIINPTARASEFWLKSRGPMLP